MGRAYSQLHRGTGEWNRKIRKATEHRRLRHAAHEAMREASIHGGFGADDLDGITAAGRRRTFPKVSRRALTSTLH